MGCCSSTDRGDEANQANRQVIADSTTAQETQERGRGIANVAQPNDPSPSPARATSATAPNRPLVLPPPSTQIALPLAYSQTSRQLTQSLLQQEREAFFDTRVTGRREIWAALKIVCSLLEAGDAVQAQTILDAVECTCPSGEVWEPEGRKRGKGGVFDQLGEKYVVPAWVVGVPGGIVSSEDAAVVSNPSPEGEDTLSSREKTSSLGSHSLRHESGEDLSSAITEKGKGRAIDSEPLLPTTTNTEKDSTPTIKVRARLSHNAQDVIVKFKAEDTVAVIMEKIKEKGQLKSDAGLKIFYLGRVLKATESLEAQGWTVGHILNVYVFDPV